MIMHLDGESTSPLRCLFPSCAECCRQERFKRCVLLSPGGRFEPTHDVECESDLGVGAINFGSHKPSMFNLALSVSAAHRISSVTRRSRARTTSISFATYARKRAIDSSF